MSDFDIWVAKGAPSSKPTPGARLKSVIIQGGRGGEDPMLLIDNVTIGEGQPPEPPKD